MENNATNGTNPLFCAAELDASAATLWTIMVISIGICLFASCFRQRKQLCVNWCRGIPGLKVPLNMLDDYNNRMFHVLSFGVTISEIFLVLGNYGYMLGSSYDSLRGPSSNIKDSTTLLVTILFSLVGFPFFLCHTFSNQLLGLSMGLVFSILWICLQGWKISATYNYCQKYYPSRGKLATRYAIQFPQFICLALLAIKYVYEITKVIRKKISNNQTRIYENTENTSLGNISKVASKALKKIGSAKRKKVNLYEGDVNNWKDGYVYNYVKKLLKRREVQLVDLENNKGVLGTIKAKLKDIVYINNPDFKYSTRIVVTFSLSLMAIALCVVLVVFVVEYGIGDILKDARMLDQFGTEYMEGFYFQLQLTIYIATSIVALLSVLIVLHSLACYREHCLKLRKGDRSFLPESLRIRIEEPSSLIGPVFRFAGFQIAHVFGAFAINIFFIGWITFVAIFLPAALPTKILKEIALKILNIVGRPIITIVIVWILERIFLPKIFLFDQERFVIDNRRLFHIYTYITFFFTVCSGVVSILLRVVKALIAGIVFLQQLQNSIFPRRFEERDGGYMSYISYLLLEHQHSNPVLQCFVRLLLESQGKKIVEYDGDIHTEPSIIGYQSEDGNDNDNESAIIENLRKKRTVNRWHMYLLLLQNPSLAKHRSHQINKDSSKEDESTLEIDEQSALHESQCGKCISITVV